MGHFGLSPSNELLSWVYDLRGAFLRSSACQLLPDVPRVDMWQTLVVEHRQSASCLWEDATPLDQDAINVEGKGLLECIA